MSKKTKALLSSMIVLAASIAGTANAMTLHNPIGNGGCGASRYEDHNAWAADLTLLSVPEIANGEQVLVHGVTMHYAMNTVSAATALFSCSNGVLSTNNPYTASVSWTPW